MLKEEINNASNIYDSFGLTEEQQKNILVNGIFFNFTHGDPDPQKENVKMDFFEFAKFLKLCRIMEVEIDVNDILKQPYSYKYKSLVLGLKASGILS